MKIRTAKYIVNEGMLNAYRNKLMFLASVGIVTSSLVIFGIFFSISVNLNYNIKALKEQPRIQVFCYPELNDTQINQVEEVIKKNEKVKEYKKVTKREAFEKVKEMLGENKTALEGLDESFLPVSFVVNLKDSRESEAVTGKFKEITGVEKVRYPEKTIEIISKITYWIRLISASLITILLFISMFIIANTIKLTVFARRKEINIMKYIGATDWFIRWPFIIEGVIIGFVGAIAAFILISYGYSAIEGKFNTDLSYLSINAVRIIKLNEIALQIIVIYCLIGVVVGSLGSFISIRKYLHV